jgi:Zn-dependent peptidase ImmA (M78 family)
MSSYISSLDQDRIQQIENLALDLLVEAYGSSKNIKSPVDLTPLFKRYDIKIYKTVFEDDNIAGKYVKTERAIYVRSGDLYISQAFTAAHMLGHFFLHPHKETEVFYRSEQFLLDDTQKIEEKEVNWFAASILMPKPNVENITFLTKKIEEVSGFFQVSNSTAYYRLKNLGILAAV